MFPYYYCNNPCLHDSNHSPGLSQWLSDPLIFCLHYQLSCSHCKNAVSLGENGWKICYKFLTQPREKSYILLEITIARLLFEKFEMLRLMVMWEVIWVEYITSWWHEDMDFFFFSPQEDKIYIFKPPCTGNFLFIIWIQCKMW